MADLRCLVLLLLTFLATAAELKPSVELTAAPAQCAVGESVVVTITYRWPHGWAVANEPDPTPGFREQFVTAAPPPVKSSTGAEERREFRLTLAATRSGAWLLPRPAFTATGPGGPVEAKAPEVIVQVGTDNAPPRLPEPRPLLIRPPEAEAQSRLAWWLGGAGVLVAAAVGAYFYFRRHPAFSGPTPAEIFARDLALAAQAKEGKDAGTLLSLALRRFAGAIWKFDGPGQTTREMGFALRSAQVPEDESRALLRLLERLDDLRWAGGDLPVAEVQPLLDDGRGWMANVQRRLDAEAEAAAQRRTKGKA